MVRRVVASGDSGWAPTALHKEEECERQLHLKEKPHECGAHRGQGRWHSGGGDSAGFGLLRHWELDKSSSGT
jgi:hypothetical protein